jgi:hypothetical protein
MLNCILFSGSIIYHCRNYFVNFSRVGLLRVYGGRYDQDKKRKSENRLKHRGGGTKFNGLLRNPQPNVSNMLQFFHVCRSFNSNVLPPFYGHYYYHTFLKYLYIFGSG